MADAPSTRATSFLYADPTPNALQVFLNRPGVKSPEASDLPAEQGAAEGIWIMADPISGCIVCNIGASEQLLFFRSQRR